ncbi:MAG: chromate efflux transporter [Steroidobacteraceae bacterium]
MWYQCGRALPVLRAFLQLGLTSFGGPVAHLGYFRRQFVDRRGWLTQAEFAELVALCQFLPGPASSQVGIAIGLRRAGVLGALAAWLGFTLPSALLLVACARHLSLVGWSQHAPWLQGLLIVAVAVVAQAVLTMGRQFCVGVARIALALVAAAICTLSPGGLTQIAVLAGAALVGRWLPGTSSDGARLPTGQELDARSVRRRALACLLAFVVLLFGLPLATAHNASHGLELVTRFYRTGALVFGGGHVVLPLLRAQVVPPGWISDTSFLAGYGLAQAVPGPLFSFAAYLGAAMQPPPNGWWGAAICLLAIYLPSFLLIGGVLPFWSMLRQQAAVRAALGGVNAAVVGVLLSALYRPVFVTAIHGVADFVAALVALGLLAIVRLPSWAVLALCVGYALLRADGS